MRQLTYKLSVLFSVFILIMAFVQPSTQTSQGERVIGQPASEEEMHAWNEISETGELEEKAELSQNYLERFPDGGFAPFAHEIIAFYHQSKNEWDEFFEHGEKALVDLPQEVTLLTGLAVAYIEQQKPNPAIEHGDKAIQLLPEAEKPEQIAASEWETERERLLADAHYAVGTARLLKAFNDRGNVELKESSIAHLEEAVEIDPGHQRAQFRLGFAYQLGDELEKAILSYARAAALGGPNAPMARSYLEKAYQSVHGDMNGIDELISQQQKHLEAN